MQACPLCSNVGLRLRASPCRLLPAVRLWCVDTCQRLGIRSCTSRWRQKGLPCWQPTEPFAPVGVLQAIRIAVNGELQSIAQVSRLAGIGF